MMAQSGGIFEATALARACEVSRTTVTNYAAVLEATFVVHLIRPFGGGGTAEIVSASKAYGFDTGFVCYHRGWHELRRDDLGLLWEHLVLNELHAKIGARTVHYWRSKHGNEIDFVLASRGQPLTAIECKWSAAGFDPAGLTAFRNRYPEGPNYVVSTDADASSTRRYGGLTVHHVSLRGLTEALRRPGRGRR